jgi:hypothetical protein
MEDKMPRTRKPTPNQEDTMATDTDTPIADGLIGDSINSYPVEQDGTAGGTVDVDVEEIGAEEPEEETTEGDTVSGDKAAKEPAKPKKGDLPEGFVTPIQFAKVIGERGLHTDRDGNVVTDVKPQMVYSYMKNSPKEDRLDPQDIEDSNGVKRSVLKLDDAIAWWERKNERAATRKANAKAKAEKPASRQSRQADVETGEADPSVLEDAEEAE